MTDRPVASDKCFSCKENEICIWSWMKKTIKKLQGLLQCLFLSCVLRLCFSARCFFFPTCSFALFFWFGIFFAVFGLLEELFCCWFCSSFSWSLLFWARASQASARIVLVLIVPLGRTSRNNSGVPGSALWSKMLVGGSSCNVRGVCSLSRMNMHAAIVT